MNSTATTATKAEPHMHWTKIDAETFESVDKATKLTLRVVEFEHKLWRATSAATGAPVGHIKAYKLCESRKRAMDWCREQIVVGPADVMHLIAEKK